MFKLQKNQSDIFDQDSFYPKFIDDLARAKHQVIIECPFITTRRVNKLLHVLRRLNQKGVKIIINTKPIDEQDPILYIQAYVAISKLQDIGVLVLFTVGHHRKLAILDKRIVWEGSLNILSQNDSCEIMRRIESRKLAKELIQFLGIDQFLRCYD
jgi:phosphatidylserine/phosphatidylglycerophosphate/cardiolipin synthase-like enzyme